MGFQQRWHRERTASRIDLEASYILLPLSLSAFLFLFRFESFQLRKTSDGVPAFTSPNTCGCRSTSLLESLSSTSSIENVPCSLPSRNKTTLAAASLLTLLAILAHRDYRWPPDLVSFFQRVGFDGVKGLLAVPGAASGRAQPRHDGHYTLKTFSSCGIENHCKSRGKARQDRG